MSYRILRGDALTVLRTLPENSAHCICTSPPYYAQRKYKAGPSEMGSEATPEEHIAALVAVFRECRRVLRPDGTMWVNYGDKAANSGLGGAGSSIQENHEGSLTKVGEGQRKRTGYLDGEFLQLPWKLALALRDDGWVLHPEVIWHKPAPMPESVSGTRWEQHRVKASARATNDFQDGAYEQHKQSAGVASRAQREAYFEGGIGATQWADCPGCARCAPNGGLVLRRGSWRPTRSHEYIFMLTKSEDYYADQEAVRETLQESTLADKRNNSGRHTQGHERGTKYSDAEAPMPSWYRVKTFVNPKQGRNSRSVWKGPAEPLFRLRQDLSASDRAYVLGELLKTVNEDGNPSTV